MTRRIDLSFYSGVGVIISWPSGVFYTNQTRGHACEHPEEEGVFLPLPERGPETPSPLLRRFEEHFIGGWHHLLVSDADFIDAELRALGLDFVEVDRAMINNSFEAWVRVRFRRSPDAIVGFDGATGILTWPNSD